MSEQYPKPGMLNQASAKQVDELFAGSLGRRVRDRLISLLGIIDARLEIEKKTALRVHGDDVYILGAMHGEIKETLAFLQYDRSRGARRCAICGDAIDARDGNLCAVCEEGLGYEDENE